MADTQWAMLEPLVEQCRPKGRMPPQDLRRTFEAILWRHENGAMGRAIATRYEKTARSFLGVLCVAATLDWIKR